MALFVITYTYSADQTADRDTHRPAHRDYLRGLVEAGSMLSSGAHVDGSGATLIASAPTAADVEAIVAADPFVQQGLAGHRVVEWLPVLGAFS